MSYGRGNGLPGQTGGRGQGRGQERDSGFDFPGPAPGGSAKRKLPGGKAGGGGIMMLLIIGAVMFFMMRGGLGGGVNQGQPDKGVNQGQDGDISGQPWRPGENQGAAQNERQKDDPNRVQIPGLDGGNKKSDKVETDDGWSMEDAKQGDKNNLPLSNQNQKPKSDKVKTEDGWEMGDAKQKKKDG